MAASALHRIFGSGLTPDRRKTVPPLGPPGPPRRLAVRPDAARLSTGVGAFALVFALALVSGASAGSPALVSPHPNRFEPYRFFGDRTVAVPLLVHAPEPEGLSLRAQLVQLTSDLAVPIGAEVEVPLPRDVSPRSRIEIELSIPLPAVKRETDFELRIRSRRDRDEVWQAAGRIGLRVYAGDLLSPVRSWANSHPLRVEDDHGSLIGFLRQQRIPMVEGRGTRGFRDARGVTLYAGERALHKRARVPLREDEAIVLFTERQTETPRFLIERTGRATAVTVEMRLVDRLATDPLAQKIFLEVFQLVHEEKTSTGGEVR